MADPPTKLVEALQDRYVFEGKIGFGGITTVYRALDVKHDRQVAIKVVRPEISAEVVAERFLHEIKVVAQLHHPHILPLFDSGRADEWLFCVVPFVDGESLRTKLTREGELPIPEALKILCNVADALSHAHAQGFVHCRITPENVMMTGRHAVVTDFGITTALTGGSSATRSEDGFVIGTPLYMAPEQIKGDSRIDHRADIYALGVLTYEMLAGRPPFLGATSQDLFTAHLSATPDDIRMFRDSVPAPLGDMVMQCLRKRAADRIQSAEQLMSQAEQMLAAATLPTPSVETDVSLGAAHGAATASSASHAAMSDPLERLKAVLASRYDIESEIGRGGMAVVLVARDRKHPRKVAIKVLRPELAAAQGRDRFMQEIEIVARLRHPHVLPLYDSGNVGGLLYYIMPFVEGGSLRDKMLKEKQLPIAEALSIACEVGDALGSAHRRKLVHRDIKPENILFEEGHAVVTDFGISRPMSVSESTRITEEGFSPLTPTYASPEQAAGERDLDGRSDVYALGCVLYEMLAGEPPFVGPTPESVLRKHISAEPMSLATLRPTVPQHVVEAVNRALAKAPADRFGDADEFVNELKGRRAAQPHGEQPAGETGQGSGSEVGLVTDLTLEEVERFDPKVRKVVDAVTTEGPRAVRVRSRPRVWGIGLGLAGLAVVATATTVLMFNMRAGAPDGDVSTVIAPPVGDSAVTSVQATNLAALLQSLRATGALDDATVRALQASADSGAALLVSADTLGAAEQMRDFRQRVEALRVAGVLSGDQAETLTALAQSVSEPARR